MVEPKRGTGTDGFSVALPELAREAGATPAATQVALTRLAARGVVRVRGRGVLADLLVKPGPLSRRELLELTKRFEGRSAIETRHLEEIGRYASLTTCRRSRLLSYFGDGAAKLVAPVRRLRHLQYERRGTQREQGLPQARPYPRPRRFWYLLRRLSGANWLRNVVFGSI